MAFVSVLEGQAMLSDVQWGVLEPLIEQVRPHAKVPQKHLRRTMSAILWRHQNGAKWRSIPTEFGPWWMAAQTFIRWARLGVWERLLALVQAQGSALGDAVPDGPSRRAAATARGRPRGGGGRRPGIASLDGTSVRAHQKAGGAARKGALKRNGTYVKRLAAHVAALEPRPGGPPAA